MNILYTKTFTGYKSGILDVWFLYAKVSNLS